MTPSQQIPPPYPTADTTTTHLYHLAKELANWLRVQASTLSEPFIEAYAKHCPPIALPEPEMLRAVSIWQLYRTVRTFRAVRINWDWLQRELGPSHPNYQQQVFKTLSAAHAGLKFMFTTASEFRAQQAGQSRAMAEYMRNILKQEDPDNPESTDTP